MFGKCVNDFRPLSVSEFKRRSFKESPTDSKHILITDDVQLWHDVHSTLLDIVDRVVTIEDTRRLILQYLPKTIIKLCLPQTSALRRGTPRSKHSIATQTYLNCQQQRHVKVQTNTVTLSSLPKHLNIHPTDNLRTNS
jgi:hypothetical protein